MIIKSLSLAAFSFLTFAMMSCSSGGEGGNQPLAPGEIAVGAVGCTQEQKKDIESMPGMGSIATTTATADGSYIYSDTNGNTCTLDKEGDLRMSARDGSVVLRDHTVKQSSSAQATELTGKVMVGATFEELDIECQPEKIKPLNIETILTIMPEAEEYITVSVAKAMSVEQSETKYDSVAIRFENELCIYKTIGKHELARHYYNNVEKNYKAHDGYFDWRGNKMHLKVDGDMAVVYYTHPESDNGTRSVTYVDIEPFQMNGMSAFQSTYNTAYKVLEKTVCDYECDPSSSEYFNYTIQSNGDLRLTNKRKAIWIERESRKYYEDKDNRVKLEVMNIEDGFDDVDDEDDEDDEISVNPYPEKSEDQVIHENYPINIDSQTGNNTRSARQ